MALEQGWGGRLNRTAAFAALDPTEKGMVSYFLGMTLCKLFASKLLATPWLLHLDVFRPWLNAKLLGRSRPDLVGQNSGTLWHAFESKGRSSVPSTDDKAKAKAQAQRLVSVNGTSCSLHIGSFAFFKSDVLEFYWRDPEPEAKEPLELPQPREEWRYYFEYALSLAAIPKEGALASELERADVAVKIHPKIRRLLEAGRWFDAREATRELQFEFASSGYQSDGLRVIAGPSWLRSSEERG
jgi:hypothetical protein